MTVTGKILFLCLLFSAKIIAQREVGDKCGENNQNQCRLVTDCPEAVQKLKRRQHHGLERCGFQGKIEIVCCTQNDIMPRFPLRNRNDACEQYSKDYSIKLEPFIIRGVNASLGEFPYIAALGFPDNNGGTLWGQCGGSLISENFVLTAAHCLVRMDDKEPNIVRLGKIDLFGDDDNVEAQDIPVEDTIIHPQYNHREVLNDIALVKLKRNVIISSNVNPVCLYTEDDFPTNFIVAGWGTTDAGVDVPARFLQKARVQLYDHDKCNESYYGSLNRRRIFDTQLCALSKDDQPQDACRGDSGGPIQIENTKGNKETPLLVVGVTSFGKGCGSGKPGIYTKVYNYMEWIEKNVWPQDEISLAL